MKLGTSKSNKYKHFIRFKIYNFNFFFQAAAPPLPRRPRRSPRSPRQRDGPARDIILACLKHTGRLAHHQPPHSLHILFPYMVFHTHHIAGNKYFFFVNNRLSAFYSLHSEGLFSARPFSLNKHFPIRCSTLHFG